MQRRNLTLDVFDAALVLPALPHVNLGGTIATPHLAAEEVFFIGIELIARRIPAHLLVVVQNEDSSIRTYPLVDYTSEHGRRFVATHTLPHAKPAQGVDAHKVDLSLSYEIENKFVSRTVRECFGAYVSLRDHYEGKFWGEIFIPSLFERVLGHIVGHQEAVPLARGKAKVRFSTLDRIHHTPTPSGFANARCAVCNHFRSAGNHRSPQKFSGRQTVSDSRPISRFNKFIILR